MKFCYLVLSLLLNKPLRDILKKVNAVVGVKNRSIRRTYERHTWRDAYGHKIKNKLKRPDESPDLTPIKNFWDNFNKNCIAEVSEKY